MASKVVQDGQCIAIVAVDSQPSVDSLPRCRIAVGALGYMLAMRDSANSDVDIEDLLDQAEAIPDNVNDRPNPASRPTNHPPLKMTPVTEALLNRLL